MSHDKIVITVVPNGYLIESTFEDPARIWTTLGVVGMINVSLPDDPRFQVRTDLKDIEDTEFIVSLTHGKGS